MAQLPVQAPAASVASGAPVLSRPTVATVAVCLGLLLGLQPVASDSYLPALPYLAKDFVAPMSAVQLTLSAMILAFGAAQLFWGPLADRVGRRPVLRAGLVLLILASVGCAFASSISTLIAWRVAQGAALAAAVVCARATLRDLYEPAEGARVMSLAMTGLALMAIGGPLLGSLAVAHWGWRGPLALAAVVAAVTLAVVTWRLPETLAQRNPRATQWRVLLPQLRQIAVHRVFVAWTLLTVCTYGMLYVWLAASSFVYIQVYGLSVPAYGLTMAGSALSYLLGTLLCRRWVPRWGMAGTVARGGFITTAAALALVGLMLSGERAVWPLMAAQYALLFAHGLHQPCAQAGMTGPFPQAAGTAAALAGAMVAVVAFGIGQGLGWAMDGSARPMAYATAFWALATAFVAWTLVAAIAAQPARHTHGA